MNETRKRLWDVRLGITGALLTVFATLATIVGILVGIHQFNEGEINKAELQHRQVMEKDELDFKRRLWLERLNAYRTTSESVGKIVSSLEDEHALKDNVRLYASQYWGTMILVEDQAVESAMIKFMLEINDFESKSGYSDAKTVKKAADKLITAFRKSAEDRTPR
jgi:hypothetical protein